jgi:hypothetical protein
MDKPASVDFDFDAMLMYGWLADKDLHVTAVNQSLQWWMTDWAPELLGQIRRGEKPTVQEFIAGLLDDNSEEGTGDLIDSHLGELIKLIDSINEEQSFPEIEFSYGHGYTIRRVVRHVFEKSRLLVAIRLVKPGGSQMNGGDYRDRVDFVCVCIVCRDNKGAPWVVKGFQGQLQEAWLRVGSVIQMGTQVGATALMGRNLSHNIGSHVLYWLSQDEREETRQRFLRYIQVRMELIAGFATCMPLSPSTFSLSNLIRDFGSNTPLLERICKSEGIGSVDVEYMGDEQTVSIPGGDIGTHALFSIIENCIRDSGKHALLADPETADLMLSVIAADHGDLVQVTVFDNRSNYDKAILDLEEILANLRVADETGRLIPGGWGVKERFICASFLRGIRLEQIEFPELGRLDNLSLGCYAPEDEPRILAIRNVEGNLSWTFYLLKPERDVLLISDNKDYRDLYASRQDLAIQDIGWLKENIDEPRAVRHRFIVFDPLSLPDLKWLASERVKLPERMFIITQVEGDSPYPWLAPLATDDVQNLSVLLLQRRWVEYLLRCKGLVMPTVILAEASKTEEMLAQEPKIYMVPQQFEPWLRSKFEEKDWEGLPVVVFRRHTPPPPLWKEQGVRGSRNPQRPFHLEFHDDGGSLRPLIAKEFITDDIEKLTLLGYRLIEAALIRVLIVDERIDASMSKNKIKLHTKKELLHWKGIDVHGIEYSVGNPPGPDVLFGWLEEGYYDIVLLHQGVADKIRKLPDGMTTDLLCSELQARARQVVIHSGRMDMAQLPPQVKFLSFSNLISWLDRDESKLHIVEELSALRRV